ncbi:MAG TPA: formate dehydrogenase accessory sulfurtransferase FdhD [Terriglobales bacterium]|nr:formate dehydrogenase accessory sulfurtransferase FdhD [Terriglobales bacterium]
MRSQSKPQSKPSIALTSVDQWEDGSVSHAQDYLAVEEPLEIRMGNTPISVTMRTPGHDLELTTGFLFTEGIIYSRAELCALEATSANTVTAQIASGAGLQLDLQRNFFAASSCGICGKATIESVRVRGIKPVSSAFQIDPDVLCSLPQRLRESQAVFGRTGGLHAAAAFTAAGEMLALREDIGRHNAVDKVVGWALLNDHIPLSNSVLMVSGRGGFEIAQKAILAGIPILASVSAPSSLAVQIAREFGMTMVGFLRGRRFVAYSAPFRVTRPGEHEGHER